MNSRPIIPGVDWVGTVDWERQYFDAFMPLPEHTSYNAYLIRGSEKTVLVDATEPYLVDVLMARLEGVKKIDFILSLHAEQDHSGGLPAVLEKYPAAQLMASPKGKEFLSTLLPIPADRIQAVQDGETLSLGDKTLRFIHIPWVHWPDTLAVFLEQDRLLFTTDFFGAHLATPDLFASANEARVYRAAKRYYAEIMMPLRNMAQKNLEKLQGLDAAMIATSHGPIYDRPEFILNAYRDWMSGPLRNAVVLPFITMHGSTLKMVTHFAECLAARGVAALPFELLHADTGDIAEELVDAATLVLGTPTTLGGPHPAAANIAYLVNLLKPRLKFISVIGSYGWGGRSVEMLTEMLSGLKAEALPPVLAKGLPGEADLKALDDLAGLIAEKHQSL
ncbi:MAG: FprA family A-type flavoprotein [Anaerolineaceae bacterium]|nr:FprA family A-type flavoprotein [Anaerolineaceae bacterium]MBN2677333.1 FprA family A-type flavoprotein [Anaerolineaceae bacterium]